MRIMFLPSAIHVPCLLVLKALQWISLAAVPIFLPSSQTLNPWYAHLKRHYRSKMCSTSVSVIVGTTNSLSSSSCPSSVQNGYDYLKDIHTWLDSTVSSHLSKSQNAKEIENILSIIPLRPPEPFIRSLTFCHEKPLLDVLRRCGDHRTLFLKMLSWFKGPCKEEIAKRTLSLYQVRDRVLSLRWKKRLGCKGTVRSPRGCRNGGRAKVVPNSLHLLDPLRYWLQDVDKIIVY